MQIEEIKAGKSKFPVRFVNGVFTAEDSITVGMIREACGVEKPRIMLVADANVVARNQHLGTHIGKYLQTNNIKLAAPPVLVTSGEKAKLPTATNIATITDVMENARIGKNDVMVAIGGGALFDVASFAAVQFHPGIKTIRIPTSVAAFVDGAFAEEARLDLKATKDALRISAPPAGVIIDFAFVSTILDGVWKGGIGEVIRYAASCDSALMKKIAKNAKALHERQSPVGMELIKAAVVSRAKTGGSDFALWCAERLEEMSAFKLPHGYAVPIAVCIECAYSVHRHYLKPDDQETICRALADCGALDGLDHNTELMANTAELMKGLDNLKRINGSETRTLVSGVGKKTVEAEADRDAYAEVCEELSSVSSGVKE